MSAPPETDEVVEFSADQVTYDSEADLVTAIGQVRTVPRRQLRRRRPGRLEPQDRQVRAQGNVVVVNPEGDKFIGDNVVLTDTLRDGTVENLLIVLESGGRIAATSGHETGDITDARQRDLLALPGHDRNRLPA